MSFITEEFNDWLDNMIFDDTIRYVIFINDREWGMYTDKVELIKDLPLYGNVGDKMTIEVYNHDKTKDMVYAFLCK